MNKQFSSRQVLIAVAPNGARRQQADTPGIPLSAEDLARCAEQSVASGAAMIHLHVREESGQHSLSPSLYRKAIAAVERVVGERMLIQISSEAAGIFTRQQQIESLLVLRPQAVSIAIRELFPRVAESDAQLEPLLAMFRQEKTLVQFIVYGPEDIDRFNRLVETGVFSGISFGLLLVIGRESQREPACKVLDTMLAAVENPCPWMLCAFGPESWAVLQYAVTLGGQVRVGFENGTALPDGDVASRNEQLVAAMNNIAKAEGLGVVGGAAEAAVLLGAT